MNREGIGVDIESQRLVAVLERAVHALELLATVPTPETTVSIDAFIHDREPIGDERREALEATVIKQLDAHFRIEAALASRREQRRASQVKAVAAISPRPEEDEAEEPGENQPALDAASGSDEDEDDAEQQDSESDDGDWDDDHAAAFPRSLHGLVSLLSRDKPTRDALRRLSATRVTPDFAALVHAATDLIQLSEHSLATTPEQDLTQRRRLTDAAQRLRECQDDATQLRFELAQARDARNRQALASVQSIATLREQLSETQRQAAEAMRTTQRAAEDAGHAMRTQFDGDRAARHEQSLALARNDVRVADAHQLEEADDRRRVARAAADIMEVVHRYDDEMAALDEAIDTEMAELQATDAALRSLGGYFERIDEDKHYALEEQRAIALAEQLRKRRELDMFTFVARVQAAVRGFLARRRLRKELKGKKKKKKKASKKKATRTKARK